MRKAFSLLSLAVLTVGLLGSCSKINERLDNLEKDVNGLKNEKIASIESQIASITSSIADLGTIRSDISSLKQSAENHGIDIFNLEEADRALADRILNLEDYLDDVLPNYAEKEWVEATFSTLEQYEATCDTIAKIDARIGVLDAKLSNDIQSCADSMKIWVNEQLDAYYTAAQMDAKLAQMKSAIDSSKASGKITDAKTDSIARELAKTKTAVDTAKANIRKEYKAAIKSAIDSSEARLTKKIQNKINKANKGVEELAGRVSDLEAEVDELIGRVEKLEGMIQAVVIVPAYSDGSVKVEDDTLFIDCVITPAEAVEVLDTADFTILLNRVQTKAVALDTVPTASIKVFTKETKSGTVSIQAYIPTFLAELGDESLTVAVNVQNGLSDYTTEFVPVYVAGPVLPAGALPGEFSVSATRKVHFSQGNLVATIDATGAPTAWKFATNQYDYIGGNVANTSIGSTAGDVDLFGWSTSTNGGTSTTDNYGIKISTESSDYAGNFYDWGKAIGDGNTWRTLSKDEWTYLINMDGPENIRKGKYKDGVTVCEKTNCLILAPDDFEGTIEASYDASAWATAEASGLVCLPAAGYRNGLSVRTVGESGYYWSSTAYNVIRAYDVLLGDSIDGEDRDFGVSVRLVTDVSAAPAPTEPDFVVMKMGSGQSKTLKWRKMNLGATTVAGSASTCYGNLYSWGNPTGSDGDNITSPGFTSGNYQDPGKSISKAEDWVTATHDAAYNDLGGKWRMPTSQEFKDLADACGGSSNYDKDTYKSPETCGESTTFSKGIYWCASYDGVAGCLFCDGTNKLFFPAAGYSISDSRSTGGFYGNYWSSTWDGSGDAYYLEFGSSDVSPQYSDSRYYGRSVRPVSD